MEIFNKNRDLYETIEKLLHDNNLLFKGGFNELVYSGKPLSLDVYYNSIGHPSYIHDEFGSEGLANFELILIKEILYKNNANDILKVSHDAYAIIHKDTNCDSFELEFRGLQNTILKKTIDLIIR